MSVLPYPHGTAAGTIGEGAWVDQSTIGGTAAGMFVAPGEAGSSAGNNRAHWGLSVNVDHIMGRIQRELPQPTTSAYTAGVGGDANVQVTATAVDVFIGLVGYAGDDINSVVRVLDREGNQLTVDGQPVMITNIQKPLGGDIFPPLATVDQFQTDPFVVFSTPIPEGADYQLVYAVNTQVEELGQDCLMADRTQFYATRNVRTVQVVDRTTANAIVGPTPVLPFNPTEFGWPDFYCHVRGKIFAVAAGTLAVANNSWIVAYVDEFGAVNVNVNGGAYQAVSPEDNLVLAYGQTDAVGAWSDDTDMAMALTSYPVYVTVGRSHTAETNFDDLQKAIDFIGYLWQYISDEAKMADDVFGLPRIMIVSAVSVSSTINLGSPIWIEGAFADRRQATMAFRRPQLEFDVVADLFDCVDGAMNYPMVVKDLWLVYTPAGDRTGYMFFKPGKKSVFDHVYVDAVVGTAYTGGFVDVGGRGTKLVDCRVVHGSDDVGGLPVVNAVYVDADKNADNLLIDRCELGSLDGSNNERLIVGDKIDGLVVRDTELSLCNGVDVKVTGVGGANGKITLERVVSASTHYSVEVDANAAAVDTDLVVEDCTLAGLVMVGHGESLRRSEIRGTKMSAEVDVRAATNIFTKNGMVNDCAQLIATGNGKLIVEDNDFVYDVFGHYAYALGVIADAAVGDLYDISVVNNRVIIDTVLATSVGIYLHINAGAFPEKTTVVDNNVRITTSASAKWTYGIKFDNLPTKVGDVVNNKVYIDANTLGFDAFLSAGIYLGEHLSGEMCWQVHRNHVVLTGGSAALVCAFVDIDVMPCGIIAFCADTVGECSRISLVDNNVRCTGSTVHTGICVEESINVYAQGNEVDNCFRGIILHQAGASPVRFGKATVIGNVITRLGEKVTADDPEATWYNSACGIWVGGTVPVVNLHTFESAVVGDNTVISNVIGVALQTRRLYNVQVDNAVGPGDGGPITFFGNNAIDTSVPGYDNGIVVNPPVMTGWDLDPGAGALAAVRPAAAVGVGNCNTAVTRGVAMTVNPA